MDATMTVGGGVVFLYSWSQGLIYTRKGSVPNLCFSILPSILHASDMGRSGSYTASHRCCLTPLTQLVPDVAHLFQTSSSMSNPISLTLGTHLLYPQRRSIFESLGKILQLLFFSSLFIFNLLLMPKSFTPLTSLLMWIPGAGPLPSLPYI